MQIVSNTVIELEKADVFYWEQKFLSENKKTVECVLNVL